MKTCTACFEEKPISHFYSKTSQCKPCKNIMDAGRARHNMDRTGENMQEMARMRKRRWASKNKDAAKSSARAQIKRAVSAGILVRPNACSDCGSKALRGDGVTAIQGHHHKGYDCPLDVLWLCPKCHRHHENAARNTTQQQGG